MSSAVVAAVLMFTSASHAADYYVPASPSRAAVDGGNGKLEVFGGGTGDRDVYGVAGSFSQALPGQFGVQFDGMSASLDNNGVYGFGGHLFWRDPSIGLLGIVGNVTHWEGFQGVNVNRIAFEGEYYLNRFTIRAVAGGEWGSSTTTFFGTGFTTFNVGSRFFDSIDVAYYPDDDFKIFAGHRYYGGLNALALGGEHGMPIGNGAMASLFFEGRIGESDYWGALAGVKMYFGQRDKSLIRRHREDDPDNPLAGGTDTFGNTSGSTTITNNDCNTKPSPPGALGILRVCGPR
ncbi:MAG: hypothetical protein JO254_04555 [Pseudolabrys sp.]|nr:hypothetical protein [Pseudolabrys sp.]